MPTSTLPPSRQSERGRERYGPIGDNGRWRCPQNAVQDDRQLRRERREALPVIALSTTGAPARRFGGAQGDADDWRWQPYGRRVEGSEFARYRAAMTPRSHARIGRSTM